MRSLVSRLGRSEMLSLGEALGYLAEQSAWSAMQSVASPADVMALARAELLTKLSLGSIQARGVGPTAAGEGRVSIAPRFWTHLTADQDFWHDATGTALVRNRDQDVFRSVRISRPDLLRLWPPRSVVSVFFRRSVRNPQLKPDALVAR